MTKPYVSRMKIQRTIKGYTLVMLSRSTRAPEWKLSMVENGLDPGDELAMKIAEVLGCKVEDIFPVYPPSRFAREYFEMQAK